jgi:hypothetical protein
MIKVNITAAGLSGHDDYISTLIAQMENTALAASIHLK